jgi:hypothetical protein
MSDNPEIAAFSRPAFYHSEEGGNDATYGLTKREYMATHILAGIMANPERYKYIVSKMNEPRPWSPEDASRHNAEKAVFLADALLEILD